VRPPAQAPAPGERRLERPPSDRYRAPEPSAEPAPEVPARGIAIAAVVAISGAIAIVLAGGIVTMTAGLVVIAGLVGWGTAVALRAGGAGRWSRGRRAIAAAILALAGVGLGQVGLWLLARQEGGVLTLVDYLGEAFGILVPLELGIAAVTAWLASR
jgi:hypothetical protein